MWAAENGLVLVTAAKRLHPDKGKATGIDIWHAIAGRQRIEKLRRNAEIENVMNRIEFREADARQMPFGDAAYYVVSQVCCCITPEAVLTARAP